jgi:hypothetical protein
MTVIQGSELVQYLLDQDEAEDLKRYFQSLGKKVELAWMSPDEFLAKVPHPITPTIPALLDLREEFFSKTSLDYIRKQIMKGEKLPPLLLDYSRMWFGWPTHEGRHRAFVAKTLGIEKVPVLIVGEAESKPKKGSLAHKSSGELKDMEEGSEGKVTGRWGATQEVGKPSGSLDQILRELEASIDDESKAADSYRKLADTIRRELGINYLHLASDIESIASDELGHHSRLAYIKSVVEKLKTS